MNKSLQSTRLWRRLLVSLLVVIFAVGSYATLNKQGNRVVDVIVDVKPTADGKMLIDIDDIKDRLDAGPQGAVIGQNINRISLEGLEQFMNQDPFVSHAEIFTGYDGVLYVKIEQVEPLLRVHDSKGIDYYIGPQGEIMPLSKHNTIRVPVLTGDVPSFKRAVIDTNRLEVFDLIQAINNHELFASLIEQIDCQGDEYILFTKLNNTSIKFGTIDDIEKKLWKLEAFIKGVYPKSGWAHYKDLDLRYDPQVVGTFEGA